MENSNIIHYNSQYSRYVDVNVNGEGPNMMMY